METDSTDGNDRHRRRVPQHRAAALLTGLLSPVERIIGRRPAAHLMFMIKYPRHYLELRGALDVDGFLVDEEVVFLYEAARSIAGDRKPHIVEIGTWMGKSAVVMGKGLSSADNPRISCIDPFNGDGEPRSRGTYEERQRILDVTLKSACLRNLAKNRVGSFIQLLEGHSHSYSRDWNNSIDILFIDGNHDYASVLRDFEEWTPFLVPGGLLIMHDAYFETGGFQGPPQVVKERILGNPEWCEIRGAGTIVAARKC